MKRLLTTLALLCALSTFVFASADPFMEPQVPPFYNYVSMVPKRFDLIQKIQVF